MLDTAPGRIMPEPLFEWTREIMSGFGFCHAAAEATARMLTEADVHGLDSHGVSIVLPRYTIILDKGLVNTGDDITIVQESETTALIDGQNNLGAINARQAIDLLVEKARAHNVAWVGVCGSNHIGFLSHWCRQIVEHDMIAYVSSNSGREMAMHGTLGKTIGNNPIAIGAPGDPFPVVLDMSSSSMATGKVRALAAQGGSLPTASAMDAMGNVTTDPQVMLDEGALLPTGGHKGSGLAVMVDVVCALLTGAMPSALSAQRATEVAQPVNIGHMFGAVRIDAFCPPDEFRRRARDYVAFLHELPRLPDVDCLYLPGERSFDTARQRRSDGIPLSAEALEALQALAEKYHCPLPTTGTT